MSVVDTVECVKCDRVIPKSEARWLKMNGFRADESTIALPWVQTTATDPLADPFCDDCARLRIAGDG